MVDMKNEIIKSEITNKIYEIRGVQVMLDSDLAILYNCKNGTKTINQAVNRHINKFPERFRFQLTIDEFNNLKSQIGTSSWNNYGGIRKLPYVFTEEGVAMLATVLRTDVADEISVKIMDAFVLMKKYISSSLLEQRYINNQVMKNTEDIKLIQETLDKFENKEFKYGTFYVNEVYDAYSCILGIFESANENIVIVDNYVDRTLLDIIRELNVSVIIITKKDKRRDNLINKYLSQYNNLKVIHSDYFHDRYFIIDKKLVYHCGASINGIGKSIFSITLMGDEDPKDAILNMINKKE